MSSLRISNEKRVNVFSGRHIEPTYPKLNQANEPSKQRHEFRNSLGHNGNIVRLIDKGKSMGEYQRGQSPSGWMDQISKLTVDIPEEATTAASYTNRQTKNC